MPDIEFFLVQFEVCGLSELSIFMGYILFSNENSEMVSCETGSRKNQLYTAFYVSKTLSQIFLDRILTETMFDSNFEHEKL